MRAADQGSLNSSVLITQRYFKIENLFAVTLKTEMARFNNTGMNRSHSHFMDTFPFYAEEIHYRGQYFFISTPLPGIVACTVRMMEAHRLKPWMAYWCYAPLFRCFTLEPLNLGAAR